MPESEFASLIKPWIVKPYDQLSPEIQTIVWQWLPQRRDPRYLLPPRRFVSLWDDLGEEERLKAARNVDLAFELGFREPPEGSRDIDAKSIDIYAWEISRFGIAEKNAPPMEPTNDGGEGPVPEIPAWLSPMEFAAYAATNNPRLVARCAPDGSGCELDHLELRAIHSRSLSPTKVLEKAVDMLRAGKIVVTALRDGARREMPAEDWRYWTISTSPVVENALVVCDVERREPVTGWTNFLISREHADRVRVALLGLRVAPAAHEAPEVSELTAAAIGASITRSGAQGRPTSLANFVRPELDRRTAADETLPTMKAAAVEAKRAKTTRQIAAEAHPSVAALDQTSADVHPPEQLVLGRRADGVWESVASNLRHSHFMVLHVRNGLLVPAPGPGQAPPTDLPRYSELTVCPVEWREPPPLVRPAPEAPPTAPAAAAVELQDATNKEIDAMLRRLWERRGNPNRGLSRDKEALKQWKQAMAEQGLTSTWGMVRARYSHADNKYLRGPPGQ